MFSFKPYPYEDSQKYLRIILNAGLTRVQLESLINFLADKAFKCFFD